jgi:hypothetical protein
MWCKPIAIKTLQSNMQVERVAFLSDKGPASNGSDRFVAQQQFKFNSLYSSVIHKTCHVTYTVSRWDSIAESALVDAA